MDLLPTEEQDEIVATVRTVLAERFAENRLDEFDGRPLPTELWESFGELGWFGLGVEESAGGVGYSAVEEALVAIELGGSIAPGPFLAQLIAVHVAVATADPLLAELLSGTARAGWAEPGIDGTVATQFYGEADVICGPSPADRGTGFSLWSPEAIVDHEDLPSIDPAISLGRGRLGATPRAVGEIGPRAQLLVAAMLAGIGRATAAQSTEYGKVRYQFGQPVGGFQAVKHRCADMATRAEVAVAQVHWASLTVARGDLDAQTHADAARVVAQGAAIDNAQINVQNHGGIGFTWEHSAHRYVTRSRMLATYAAGGRAARQRLLAAPTPH